MRAGYTADLEVTTKGRTRVDVVIDGRIGIEVQRSALKKAAAVDRTARTISAGLTSVTWFTDRDGHPPWLGHVPGYRSTLSLDRWKEMPPLGTATAAGLRMIEAVRCGTRTLCPHQRFGSCGRFIAWPVAWNGLHIDNVVEGLAAGHIRPVRLDKQVQLLSTASIGLYEELTASGSPTTRVGQSRTPGHRTRRNATYRWRAIRRTRTGTGMFRGRAGPGPKGPRRTPARRAATTGKSRTGSAGAAGSRECAPAAARRHAPAVHGSGAIVGILAMPDLRYPGARRQPGTLRGVRYARAADIPAHPRRLHGTSVPPRRGLFRLQRAAAGARRHLVPGVQAGPWRLACIPIETSRAPRRWTDHAGHYRSLPHLPPDSRPCDSADVDR